MRRIVTGNMSSSSCQRCGADLGAGARFCRRCGLPTASFDGSSVTEAETRVFGATAERGPQTQYYDQRPTGPSYMSPAQMSPPQASATVSLPQPKPKRGLILLGSALMILAIISLTIFAVVKWSGNHAPTPTVSRPGAPQAPVAPQAPQIPQPQQPPIPPGAGKGSASALIYPGAEVTMEMTRGAEGSVRHLTTTDSFDKVVAWYTEKLRPKENIKSPGPTAILRGNGVTAIINVEDDLTQILLQQGIDQN